MRPSIGSETREFAGTAPTQKKLMSAVVGTFLVVLGVVTATNVGGFAAKMARGHREDRWGGEGFAPKSTRGVQITGAVFVIAGAAFIVVG